MRNDSRSRFLQPHANICCNYNRTHTHTHTQRQRRRNPIPQTGPCRALSGTGRQKKTTTACRDVAAPVRVSSIDGCQAEGQYRTISRSGNMLPRAWFKTAASRDIRFWLMEFFFSRKSVAGRASAARLTSTVECLARGCMRARARACACASACRVMGPVVAALFTFIHLPSPFRAAQFHI